MNESHDYKIKLLDKKHIDHEYYYFDFEKPKDFHYTEGQYGIFTIDSPDITGRNMRAFSIESSHDEPYIRIATRILENPSDFKKHLLHMDPGEEIKMTAPKGIFTFDESEPGVFIAGGIGITPIRSMLVCENRNKAERKDVLIYSELEECYPFKEELEQLNGLKIVYAADIEPTQNAIREAVKEHKNDAYYYLSGSPGFVKGITGLLVENGVAENKIKHDVFVGY